MSIRKKLMILFLIITLVPLIGTIAMYEISIGFFSKKVSSDMRLELEESARYDMKQVLTDYERILRVSVQLIESLVHLQAHEVEKTLASKAQKNFAKDATFFGLDKGLDDPERLFHDYSIVNAQGQKESIQVSFKKQGYFIVRGSNKAVIEKDMRRLSEMTSKYYKIYNMDYVRSFFS